MLLAQIYARIDLDEDKAVMGCEDGTADIFLYLNLANDAYFKINQN